MIITASKAFKAESTYSELTTLLLLYTSKLHCRGSNS